MTGRGEARATRPAFAGADAEGLIACLREAHPSASRAAIDRAGQVLAIVDRSVGRLTGGIDGAHEPTGLPRDLAEDLAAWIGGSATGSDIPDRIDLHPMGPVETHRGTGLGERIGSEEGERRLTAYAIPLTLERWAGPVAGPGEVSRRLGIGRSTLQDWRRSGAVIGLLRGTRKHVFPLAQFVDGRPVRGLAEIARIVGDPRTAWLWLVEPYRDGQTQLSRLRSGAVAAVTRAAREDFA